MWKSAFPYNFNEQFTKIDLYSKIIIPTCNRMQSPNIFKQYCCPNKQTFCLVYTHSLSWQSLIRLSTKNNNFQYLCRQNKNQKHALYYLFTTLLLFSIQNTKFQYKVWMYEHVNHHLYCCYFPVLCVYRVYRHKIITSFETNVHR